MASLQELILDERLESRVRAARRRGGPHEADGQRFDLPDAEGLVSPGALRRDAIYRRSLVGADILAAGLALYFAVVQVAGSSIKPAMLAAIPLVVVVGKLLGLYDRDELVFHKSTLDEAPKHFQLAGFYTLLAWLLAPTLISGAFDRRAGLALWLLAFLLTSTFRYVGREFARQAAPPERCLVVGRSGTRMRLAGKLTAARPRTEVVGYLPLDDERRSQTRWRGNDRRRRTLHIGDMPELVRQLDVHRVIVIPGDASSDTMIDAVSRAKSSGVKVSILPRMFEVVGSSVDFEDIDGVTMLGLRRFGLSANARLVKRSFDVAVAGAALLALAPVAALAALAVRLDSPGPILFRQTRVGRHGRRFCMLKFRSMVTDADSRKDELAHRNETQGFFKVTDDPRVTRAGRFLRKTSLDEIPQFLNVVRGDMSIVGPRPLIVDEDERIVGLDRSRLHLTPGMTGPWQVLGSSRIPMSEMINLDYLYVTSWSLWLDVKLLLRTFPHVLFRRGR
jgi:exopolysaccharide biosynthesis polyprenyl glycosylphosphotransferase